MGMYATANVGYGLILDTDAMGTPYDKWDEEIEWEELLEERLADVEGVGYMTAHFHYEETRYALVLARGIGSGVEPGEMTTFSVDIPADAVARLVQVAKDLGATDLEPGWILGCSFG